MLKSLPKRWENITSADGWSDLPAEDKSRSSRNGKLFQGYVKKTECPVLFTGMHGHWGFEGITPSSD
jgi:hypothetical protein